MSRLLVKNLPAYLTQSRLREHFESKDGPGGTLTDVKVVLKPDGTSRRFGFIGFKTEAEAQKAQKWFDRTYIDSSRVGVSVIDGTKDAPAPRPNKRPRLGPSPVEETQKQPGKPSKSKKEISASEAKDTEFQHFADAMKPRTKKGPSWANEDFQPGIASASTAAPTPKAGRKPGHKGPSSEPDAELEEPQSTELSDLDWLRRHQKSTLAIPDTQVDKVFEQSDDDDSDEHAKEDPSETEPSADQPEDPAKTTILQTSRLFLRNLSYACTDDELMDLFKTFGDVSQVHIPLDPVAKTPKGVAYVTFANPLHAVAAYEAMDKRTFQGRLLHILPAVDRKGKPETVDPSGKKSLKEEKDAKRKGMAGKEFNWAMLYMNSDAVVSSIADRMNVAKSDILNPESANAAVKLALAETHVIQETKSFLESHGVVLSAFDATKRIPRSDTTILVKNIPYSTTLEQIRELFQPHGELRYVLVPPAGTMAIVEFAHPDEGRRAFKAVAYRRFGNTVIYLEKGPVGMFVADSGSVTEPPEPSLASGVKPVTITDSQGPTATTAVATATISAGEGEDQASLLSAGLTLFVKNLSFATTTERLTHVFRHLPSFAFARVQMKPDAKNPGGAQLSMGYGFVGFKDPESAKKAMKSLQGYVLDGHTLMVKFAGRGSVEHAQEGEKVKGKTTKMIVKNVPFEATKKDIRELFGSHGQLKSVRLPKRFDHRSRGFAFLDFVTRREAENAHSALKYTHLLGRHLVLEWAEEAETDIDELRKKAGVGFGGGKELPGKKRKVQIGDTDAEGEEEL